MTLERAKNATEFVVSIDDRKATPAIKRLLAELADVKPLEGYDGQLHRHRERRPQGSREPASGSAREVREQRLR